MNPALYSSLLALAVAAAILWFRHQRARVGERLGRAAERLGGRMAGAPWIVYPRLVVPLQGAEVQVSCMHGGRTRRACTFAWVGCADYPALDIDVGRKPPRIGLLERMGRRAARTGDRAFDEAFWFESDDLEAATALFDGELRRALLAFDPGACVHARVGRATVYRDGWSRSGEMEPRIDVSARGLPPEVADVEKLVAVARALHAALMRPGLRQSA